MIPLIEVTRRMNQSNVTGSGKKPFSITFVELDVKRKTGGSVRTIKRALQIGLSYKSKEKEMRGLLDLDAPDQHHPIAIHTRLITGFENEQVIY